MVNYSGLKTEAAINSSQNETQNLMFLLTFRLLFRWFEEKELGVTQHNVRKVRLCPLIHTRGEWQKPAEIGVQQSQRRAFGLSLKVNK